MKETILKILGDKYNQDINRRTFLLNDDGEEVNLKTDTVRIYSDRNFELLFEEGEVFLNTTGSNQRVTQEWLDKLNDLTKIKFTLEKLYL